MWGPSTSTSWGWAPRSATSTPASRQSAMLWAPPSRLRRTANFQNLVGGVASDQSGPLYLPLQIFSRSRHGESSEQLEQGEGGETSSSGWNLSKWNSCRKFQTYLSQDPNSLLTALWPSCLVCNMDNMTKYRILNYVQYERIQYLSAA